MLTANTIHTYTVGGTIICWLLNMGQHHIKQRTNMWWLPSPHIINMLTAKSQYYHYADCWAYILSAMLTAKSPYYQYAGCQVPILSLNWLSSPHTFTKLAVKSPYFHHADCQVPILPICSLPSPHIFNMLTAKSAYHYYADCNNFPRIRWHLLHAYVEVIWHCILFLSGPMMSM